MKTEISKPKTLIITAWVTVLLSGLPSNLPIIILQEIFDYQVSNNLACGIAAVVGILGLGLTFALNAIHPLRPFFILYLVLVGGYWLVITQIMTLPIYERWLASPSPNVSLLALMARNFMLALPVMAALFSLKKKREAFFLVKGDTSAPLEPVRWLGIKAGATWKKAGTTSAIVISLLFLPYLILVSRPSSDILVRALPFLPVILVGATLNAFGEEMFARASLFSVLEDVIGRQSALWLTVAHFGLGHFYGIPYGATGVLLAGFLGWWLGKSILETRGLWWAWFIHFVQDVLILLFVVVTSLRPGGG